MKIAVLATTLIAAVVLAAPAEAASKKRQQQVQKKPAVTQNDPFAVLGPDGRIAGRDPDPHIRAMIRRDPRPWEHTN